VVFAQNGIPWWYDYPATAHLLDPGGALSRNVGARRTLGGVIQSANEQIAPGVVRNTSPTRNKLIVAEIDGVPSARVTRLRTALIQAGIESPDQELKTALWQKLIANVSVSVLAFLVERTSRDVYDDPMLAPLGEAIATELAAVAAGCGVACSTVRPAPAHGHRSSMLQDLQRGRTPETAALLDAPLLLANAAGVQAPVTAAIAALVRHKIAQERSVS
jgi:2-dehydropantoate 2-reductase